MFKGRKKQLLQLLHKNLIKRVFLILLQNQVHPLIYNVHRVLWISLLRYHGQPLLNPMDVSLGIRLMSVQEIYKSTPHQMKHIKMLKAYHQVYLEKKGKTTLEVLKKTHWSTLNNLRFQGISGVQIVWVICQF